MEIQTNIQRSALIVTLKGEIDHHSASILRENVDGTFEA